MAVFEKVSQISLPAEILTQTLTQQKKGISDKQLTP